MRSDLGHDLVIIARTDCRNAEAGSEAEGEAGGGLDEAIARCVAFEQAGADVVYAEGLNGPHELRALAEAPPPQPRP